MQTQDKTKNKKSNKTEMKDLNPKKEQSCKVQGGVVSGGNAGPEDWTSRN